MRVDKWLWIIRVFKTRTDAGEACRKGRVLINNVSVKPSRELKIGELVQVKKVPVTYTYRVLDFANSRQPAKNVPLYAENLTPQEELDKLRIKHSLIFAQRDPGAGRPTKRDRRVIDETISDFNEFDDFELDDDDE